MIDIDSKATWLEKKKMYRDGLSLFLFFFSTCINGNRNTKFGEELVEPSIARRTCLIREKVHAKAKKEMEGQQEIVWGSDGRYIV